MQPRAGTSMSSDPQIDPEPLLAVRGLTKHFDVTGGVLARLFSGVKLVKAVDGISFSLAKGQTLGLVGESGSGKSTTARLIARLIRANAGEVLFAGVDLLKATSRQMKKIRKEIQFVFQDPFSSLNPRMRVEQIVGRPMTIHFGIKAQARKERVAQLLEQVGLTADQMQRYPHEFSGGQRQRIAVARALASEPSLLLADEPVSSLDVSVQAQVLELLQELRERLQLTMIFITHDLNVAEFVSDHIAVMYGGKIMEQGPAEQVLSKPYHPYTQSLLEARPHFDRRIPIQPLAGEPATPINPGKGCRFAHRCPLRTDDCVQGDIPMEEKAPGHQVACIHV